MSYRIQFFVADLPLTPSSLNSLSWSMRDYYEHWEELIGAAVAGKKPATPIKRSVVTLVRYSSVKPDDSNLTESFKPVIQALKACRIIENEEPEELTLLWEFTKPKSGKTFVRVEERTVGAVKCITEVRTEGETNGINDSR